MIQVGIVGGSGYAGQNIIRLLQTHREAVIKTLVSTSLVGEEEPQTGLRYAPFSKEALDGMDVVFLAVPHGEAARIAPELSTRIIDLSVDHRLSHSYGLPEVFGQEIRKARIIGNPGCYATACILAVYPIRELIEYVVFDCISGYSGAGKGARDTFDYEENIIAYKLTRHFHIPEIQKVTGCSVSFTPHVVNTFAGLMCTAHIFLREDVSLSDIKQKYAAFYADTLTHVVEGIPCAKDVVGTPYCHIGGFEKDQNKQLVVVSVLDNLLKGAASQAVENMNLCFGFDKMEGLYDTLEKRI